MHTRTIGYIDPNEDLLDLEVELAMSRSMEENMAAFCENIISLYAMSNIDVLNYPIKREIYFIDDEE